MHDSELHQEPNNYLRGRDLLIARGIWGGLVLLTLGMFLAAIPFRFQQLVTVTSQGDPTRALLATVEAAWLASRGVSVTAYALFFLALETAFAAVFLVLGLLIFAHKSREGLGMFASLALITFGVIAPGTARVLDDGSGSILEGLVHVVQNIGWVSFTLCFFIFPDGRFVPRWTRWSLIPFVAWAAAWLVVPWANPFNWSLAWMLTGVLFLFSCGLLAQVYRYFFVSTRLQRVQTRWVVYAFGIATLGIVVFLTPSLLPETSTPGAPRVLYHLIGIPIFAFSLLLIPISINIAILRYRLWDIDILIRRTLVYGVLTATLVVVYLATIIFSQQAFRLITGQSSDLTIIISTLVIAALFHPLRRRVQDVIDRRFYRRKYDAQKVLERFAQTARDETDLERLSEQLLQVVDETMQPTHVSLWLTSPLHPSPSRRGDGGEVRNAFRNASETIN